MTEEKKEKEEIVYHAPVVEFDNTMSVVTNIGFAKGTKEKFQIVFPIVRNDADAAARYGCDLNYIIDAGIRQLTYRIPFSLVGFNDDGSLKTDGHEAMQELADGYKVGRQAVSPKTAEAKAAKASHEKLKSLADDGDINALLAKIAEAKAKGLI